MKTILKHSLATDLKGIDVKCYEVLTSLTINSGQIEYLRQLLVIVRFIDYILYSAISMEELVVILNCVLSCQLAAYYVCLFNVLIDIVFVTYWKVMLDTSKKWCLYIRRTKTFWK